MLGQEMTMSIFGSKLRSRREAAGVSGNQLAALAEIDQSAISKIELGKRRPSRPEMERIAERGGIGVTLSELLSWAQADRVLGEIQKLPQEQWPDLLKDVSDILTSRGID